MLYCPKPQLLSLSLLQLTIVCQEKSQRLKESASQERTHRSQILWGGTRAGAKVCCSISTTVWQGESQLKITQMADRLVHTCVWICVFVMPKGWIMNQSSCEQGIYNHTCILLTIVLSVYIMMITNWTLVKLVKPHQIQRVPVLFNYPLSACLGTQAGMLEFLAFLYKKKKENRYLLKSSNSSMFFLHCSFCIAFGCRGKAL